MAKQKKVQLPEFLTGKEFNVEADKLIEKVRQYLIRIEGVEWSPERVRELVHAVIDARLDD